MPKSASDTDDTETSTPQLTDTLITSGKEEQDDNNSEDDFEASKTMILKIC